MDEVAARIHRCPCHIGGAGGDGLDRRPHLLQYHLSGRYHPVVPGSLLVAKGQIRRREVQELYHVFKELQVILHRL